MRRAPPTHIAGPVAEGAAVEFVITDDCSPRFYFTQDNVHKFGILFASRSPARSACPPFAVTPGPRAACPQLGVVEDVPKELLRVAAERLHIKVAQANNIKVRRLCRQMT
jgi:hypothetical protein